MIPIDLAPSRETQLTGKGNGDADRFQPALLRYEVQDEVIRTADAVPPPIRVEGKVASSWQPSVTASDPLDIYPGLAETKSSLRAAVRLLDDAIVLVDEAISCEADGDIILADDAIQRMRALLPELFCCRTLGDGFGATVNGIHFSLANRHGRPLDASQMKALGASLRLLRKKPFVTLEDAIGAIDSLEDRGLLVGPEEIGVLAGITDGEGVS